VANLTLAITYIRHNALMLHCNINTI